jgi:phosphoribosylaminoimidazolecarboxamide formyltransferase/IMP cyclohydrolase
MEARGGALSEETHFALCLRAFRHTAHYDQVIAGYLAGIHGDAAQGAGVPGAPAPQALRLDLESARVLTAKAPGDEQWAELRLACWCLAQAHPHAAALAAGDRLIALSAGQPSASEAADRAINCAGALARGAVLAADGAPADAGAVEQAARAGLTALVQCGGAPADAAVIEAADRLGLVMVLTANPELRH